MPAFLESFQRPSFPCGYFHLRPLAKGRDAFLFARPIRSVFAVDEHDPTGRIAPTHQQMKYGPLVFLLTASFFISGCTSIRTQNYEQLAAIARYPEGHRGEFISFLGQVVSIQYNPDGSSIVQIYSQQMDRTAVVKFPFQPDRIHEQNWVYLLGRVAGSTDGTNSLGGSISVITVAGIAIDNEASRYHRQGEFDDAYQRWITGKLFN